MAEALDDGEGVGEGGVAEDMGVALGLEALEGPRGEGQADLDAVVVLADQDQLRGGVGRVGGGEGDQEVDRVDPRVGAVEGLEAAIEAAQRPHCRVSEPSRPSTTPAASRRRASRLSP